MTVVGAVTVTGYAAVTVMGDAVATVIGDTVVTVTETVVGEGSLWTAVIGL